MEWEVLLEEEEEEGEREEAMVLVEGQDMEMVLERVLA